MKKNIKNFIEKMEYKNKELKFCNKCCRIIHEDILYCPFCNTKLEDKNIDITKEFEE